MSTEFQPAGGTGPSQRPATSASNPNPTGAMKSSGKASESKATSSLGTVITGIYDTARPGDVTGQLPVDPIVPFVETAPGSAGNTAKTTPKISEVNEIGPTPEGEAKAKPGRQEAKPGPTSGTHPAGWVDNTWNPAFGPKPAKRK